MRRGHYALLVFATLCVLGLVTGAVMLVNGSTKDGKDAVPELPSNALQRALALQRLHPLIDGHNDLPYKVRYTFEGVLWVELTTMCCFAVPRISEACGQRD